MKIAGTHNWNAKRSTESQTQSPPQLVVVGLNYHSSPLYIREKFVIPDSCIGHALLALEQMPHLSEAVILSTCNRTEVYALVTDIEAGLAEIEAFFMHTQGVGDHCRLKPNFRLLRDDVALHLFRVASGLDSLVLGEGQIMAQVKSAHQAALEAGACGPALDQLFKLGLSCGKRVRSETSLGKRAVSVSSAGVELAREILGPLGKRNSLIVGAGKMGQICAKHLLADQGSGSVLLINRSTEKLKQFRSNKLPNPERLNTSFDFNERHDLAAAADLVVVSTSASEFVLSAPELKRRLLPGKKLCIIDISVPRNVDPAIAEIPGISLFHADDLSKIVNKNLAEREALTSEAEALVFTTLDAFHAWQRTILVAPTITELRKKIEAIRAEYLLRSEKIAGSDNDCDSGAQFEALSRALVNQILHQPTVQLKSTSDYVTLKQRAEALRTLFELDCGPLNEQIPTPSAAALSAAAIGKIGCPQSFSGSKSDSISSSDKSLKSCQN